MYVKNTFFCLYCEVLNRPDAIATDINIFTTFKFGLCMLVYIYSACIYGKPYYV